MRRTIIIEDLDALANTLAARGKSAESAVGYLATWAPQHAQIGVVRLGFLDAGDEIMAWYKDAADSKVVYAIGAVWREDEQRFTFQS